MGSNMRVVLLLFCVWAVANGSPLGCPFSGAKPSSNDMARASQAEPRARFLDATDGISHTLNQHLTLDKELSTAECASFSLDELKALQRELHCQLSPDLNTVYSAKADHRALRFADLDAFEAHW